MVNRLLLVFVLLPAFAWAADYPMNKTGTYVGDGVNWQRTGPSAATTTYHEVPTKTTVGGITGSGSTAVGTVTREIDITPPKQYPHYPKGKIIEAVKVPAPTVGKNMAGMAKNFGRFVKITPQSIIGSWILEQAVSKGWQWVEEDYSKWKDKNFPEGHWEEKKPSSKAQEKMIDVCEKNYGKNGTPASDCRGRKTYFFSQPGPVTRFTPDAIYFRCSDYKAERNMGFLPQGTCDYAGASPCGCATVTAERGISRYDAEWETSRVSDFSVDSVFQQAGENNLEKLLNYAMADGIGLDLGSAKFMVMGDTTTDRQLVSSTTTNNPDGSTTTTNNYQTTTYNYYNESSIGKTISPSSVKTTKETEVNGEVTSTTTTDTPTKQPGKTEDSSDDDDEEPITYDDPPFEPVPNLYDQKYKTGIKGVWEQKWPQLQQTGFMQSINSLIPSIGGGTCPRFELGMDAGQWFSYGLQTLNVPCWIFEVIRAIVMILAVFLARKIIWG